MCTLPVFASEAWITNAFFNAILTRYDNRGLDALYSGEASIHDDAYLQAATALYNLQQAGAFPAGVTNMTYEQCTELWYNGQAAMFFNGEWEADATYDALGDKAKVIYYPAASEDTTIFTAARPALPLTSLRALPARSNPAPCLRRSV